MSTYKCQIVKVMGIWGFGVSRFQWMDRWISRLGSESFAVITRAINLNIHKPAVGQIPDPTLYSGSVAEACGLG